jgi:hypothetical protein
LTNDVIESCYYVGRTMRFYNIYKKPMVSYMEEIKDLELSLYKTNSRKSVKSEFETKELEYQLNLVQELINLIGLKTYKV